MLVTVRPDVSLWEAVLPAECLAMPAELEVVSRLLDDPAFFAPYRAHFSALWGRPSVPLETYLRLMFLKERHGLSFEAVVREAGDSLCWRRFCRVPLGERMPHPTTLMKTTKRCGESVVAQLNEALLAKAAAARVVKLDQVRADTTVVAADVAYPTDSGLMARGVKRLTALARSLQGMGLATRTRFRDRGRSIRRRAHEMGAWLRRRTEEAKEEVKKVNAEMAEITEAALADARAVARNARRSLKAAGDAASGKALACLAELEVMIERVDRVVSQTRERLAGGMPDGATRLVSLRDPDARPIKKGRLGKPVEFGYKAQVADNRDGIILDYQVFLGNPDDDALLAPAIGRIKERFGKAPRAVTADRGYSDAATEAAVRGLGVKTVVIPKKGKKGKARTDLERSRPFRRLVKWRTGSEGRVSHLKHGYGWARTRYSGLAGAQTWCGLGVLAHNLVKIGTLIDEKQNRPRPPTRTRKPTAKARGRPPSSPPGTPPATETAM